MPRNIQLSDFEKGQIIGMHKLGATMTFIATVLNRDRSAVSRFLTRYKEGNVETVIRSGRPLIMTNMDEQNLIDAAIHYNDLPLKEILANRDINISRSLARKILHKNRIWGRIAAKKPGPLVFIKERNGAGAINARRYVEVLKDHLVPFCRELIAMFGDNIIYQDDNAPIHRARYTQEWMNNENIN
ncbi:7788_t:CDS:2, partial [Racocetra fulgida]